MENSKQNVISFSECIKPVLLEAAWQSGKGCRSPVSKMHYSAMFVLFLKVKIPRDKPQKALFHRGLKIAWSPYQLRDLVFTTILGTERSAVCLMRRRKEDKRNGVINV